MTSEVFALSAGLLQLIAHIPLIITTIGGQTKPSTTSTGIWSLVSVCILFSSYFSGVRTNLPFIMAGTLATTTVFLLSLKYGYRKWSILDPVCLILSLISLAIWFATKNAAYAVYLLVINDWLAVLPVFRKSWIDPKTENLLAWSINFVACCLLMLSVRDWRPVVSLLALTQIVHSTIVNLLLRISPNRYQTAREEA